MTDSRRIVVYCYATILLSAIIVTYQFYYCQHEVTSAAAQYRRVLLANKHNDFEHLRILAFGTSRTYGVGVNHPSKAFPSLLSRNNSKNLAIKASGPHYSALCTQTMVGQHGGGGGGGDDDQLYDVILLEYNLMADNYIFILARRLRARFPQAKIIFMRIWLPFQYRHVPSKKSVLSLIRERFGTASNSMLGQDILNILVEGTMPEDWIFQEAVDKRDLLDRVSKEVGGHVYHMPRPENAVEAMRTFGRYYTPDMNHFTPAGHRFLQHELVKMMHQINAGPTDVLGTWTDRDVCELWYETGVTSLAHDAPTVTFLDKRHALEFQTSNHFLETRNPFPDRPVSVWIDFMAGSPEGQYPISQVQLAQSPPAEIKPQLKGSTELHVMKHAQVGMLEPAARANLTVNALDSGASNFFRIVGVVYTTVQVDGIQSIE